MRENQRKNWVHEGQVWRNVITGRTLVPIRGGGAPAWDQQAFRYRNDDGTEATATWMYAQNTNGSVDSQTKFRIRFRIDEYNDKVSSVSIPNLYYNLAGGGWNPITTTSSVIRNVASDYTFVDDTLVTTERLTTPPTGAFEGVGYLDTNGSTSTSSIATKGDYFENEFCLLMQNDDVSDAQTLQIRLYDDTSALDAYTSEVSITVSKSAVTNLVVAPLSQTNTVAKVPITKESALVVDPLSQSNLVEHISTTKESTLIVDNLSQSNLVEFITGMTQQSELTVDNLAQLNTVEHIDLIQLHILTVDNLSQSNAVEKVSFAIPVKKYWNFADEVSVPAEFSEIEGGSGAVAISSDHLQITTGGTGTGDYAAAAFTTALASNKLTVIYGEVKMSGAVGSWTPNIVGLMDSSGTPVAMTSANRLAALRIWHEYQMSSGADSADRVQAKFKNPSGTQYHYIAETQTWQSTFAYTRAYFDEGSYYRFVIVYDGTTSPARARLLVYGYTETDDMTGWNINYDSTWVDFDTGSTDIDPFDNDIYVVFGDPTNNQTKDNITTFDFRRIMIGEIDTANVDEFAFTNKGGVTFPFDYELFMYLNPMPEDQTLWVSRDYDGNYPDGDNADSPIVASGSDTWVKDAHCFYDGTTYWLFYQIRDGVDADSDIYVSSTTDILNGTWGSQTEISTTDTGEDKHEFPWVTKYDGTWYMFYGVELDSGSWEIQYKTTTQANPTSGWSSASTALTAGAAGKFDDVGVSGPFLIWYSGTFTGGTWYMFYSGQGGSSTWRGGLAKSTTGITGTYTRVDDTNPYIPNYGMYTEVDGNQTDTAQITVDSTASMSVGDYLFYLGAGRPIEVLSIDSGTQFTASIEMDVSDNQPIRGMAYNRVGPRILKRINNYWVCYVTAFGYSNGAEYTSIYVATTTDIDPADCTFTLLKVGDSAIDFVIPPFPNTHTSADIANENPGTVWEELSPVALGTLAVHDLSQSNLVEKVTLTQLHVIAVDNLTQSNLVEHIDLAVIHHLEVDDLSQSNLVEFIVGMTQQSELDIDDLSQSNLVEHIDLAVIHHLAVDDLAQSNIVDYVGITKESTLVVDDLSQSNLVEKVALTQVNILIIDDLSQLNTVEKVSLTQLHILAVDDLSQSNTVEEVILSQVHNLQVDDLSQANAVSVPSLTQLHILVVHDLSQSNLVTKPVLSTEGVLAGFNLNQSNTVEKVSLTQVHNITVYDLLSTSTVDKIPVDTTTTLTISDLSVNNTVGIVTLVQIHNLSVDDLAQSNLVLPVVLTQIHVLAVDNLSQANTVQKISLATEGDVVPQSLSQSNLVEKVSLTQLHILAVDDLSQSNLVTVPAINSASTLIVYDLDQTNSIDKVSLTQLHVLSIDNLSQSNIVEEVILSQVHNLTVYDLSQATIVQSIPISGEGTVTPFALSQSSQIEKIALAQQHNVTVSDLSQSNLIEEVVLVPVPKLSMADLTQSNTVDYAGITTTYNMMPYDLAQANTVDYVVWGAVLDVHDLQQTNTLWNSSFWQEQFEFTVTIARYMYIEVGIDQQTNIIPVEIEMSAEVSEVDL